MHDARSILEAFKRAAILAKRLPNAGPAKVPNVWPEILRLNYQGYVENDTRSPALTAAELMEYKTTASWMSFIEDASYRRLLWIYAAGVPGWKIAKVCRPRISQSTISRKITWALAFIADKLNHGATPPAFEYHP